MPILDLSRFARLFAPFKNKRIVFVPLDGNVGDYLSHVATELMFDHFGVSYETVLPEALSRQRAESFDELVISGGGNMGGNYYAAPYRARQRIISFDIPVTVFPQSFIQNQEDLSPYKKIYVRENESLGLNRYFDLAPDMALGYTGPIPEVKPVCATGVFLRCDTEQLF
jgi:exopolysaccharide biosynthesis predicted pyruvyltransferase EpsI